MLLILSACQTQVRIEKSYIQIPEALLEDCAIASIKGDTVLDAVLQSLDNIESLKMCNADKQALREWNNNNKKEEGK